MPGVTRLLQNGVNVNYKDGVRCPLSLPLPLSSTIFSSSISNTLSYFTLSSSRLFHSPLSFSLSFSPLSLTFSPPLFFSSSPLIHSLFTPHSLHLPSFILTTFSLLRSLTLPHFNSPLSPPSLSSYIPASILLPLFPFLPFLPS